MTATPEDFSAFRISAGQFPLRDRREAFREIYGRAIMKLDLEPKPGIPVTFDFGLRALPDFGVASGVTSPVLCRRTTRLIESDDLILSCARTGGGRFRTKSEEAELGAGEAVMTDSTEVGTFDIWTSSEMQTFRLAFDRLAPLVGDLNRVLMRPVPRSSEPLLLLVGYVESLRPDLTLQASDVQSLVVKHIYDLVALAMGATRDAAHVARTRGVPAARLRSIKADIVRNLGQSNLSAFTVAARHGVSPRYVSMLFEREPETLSEYILRLRLDRAHRLLTDDRSAERTISSIAYEVGFGDISYFNRTFLRRYGGTPSDVRAQALRKK